MLPDELFKEQAEKSVKLGVLVSKVLADAKLEVDQARVDAYIDDMVFLMKTQQKWLNTSKW